MPFHMQLLLLLAATAFALRPAIFPRQLETCDVACGGGWCCLEFETCVANPSDTVDGGWNCVVQGVTNDDGSPMTDVPFNPTADAGVFNSLESFVSDQSSFLSSLTSALSITSLSVKSSLALPTPTIPSPTITPGTSPTSPGPKSTSSTSSLGTTSPATKTPSSIITSTRVPPSVVTTSDTSGIQFNIVLLLSLIAAMALAYLA